MRISPVQWLFLFIPIAFVLERMHVPAPLVFFSAALAIVPIATLIVKATEQIATRTGDAIGGLLNATFGNAPEIIISVVALRAGLHEMVLASLAGAILANLLLALGLAFFLGGLRHHYQDYNPLAGRVYASMMFLSVVSLAAPGAFSRIVSADIAVVGQSTLNLGLAVLLLVAYGLYLVYMLRTHPELFKSAEGDAASHEAGPAWSIPRAAATLVGASALAAWMSEILVGAAEATGKSLGMTETFIGIVFLAIVGGAAESGSAIAMARKNRMDLSLGIAMGSCIQIALFVAPLLVILSLFLTPEPFQLAFNRGEMSALFCAVLIGALVAGDGRSNWFKGVQLLTVYGILAMLFYFMPEVRP